MPGLDEFLPEGRPDWAIFILTYGRPDRVHTLNLLSRLGYSGDWWLVCSTDDDTLPEYLERFPNKVLTFDKDEIQFDRMTLDPRQGTVVFARQATHQFAKRMGYRVYAQFDDDYMSLGFRNLEAPNWVKQLTIKDTDTFDRLCEATVRWLDESGATVVAWAQGGDHIGGSLNSSWARIVLRKTMNTMWQHTDTDEPFLGLINEDVNRYVLGGVQGRTHLTAFRVQMQQVQTQASAGGMSDIYNDAGTYLKSFFPVMICPSGVYVWRMGPSRDNRRWHHGIDWPRVVPKILSPEV